MKATNIKYVCIFLLVLLSINVVQAQSIPTKEDIAREKLWLKCEEGKKDWGAYITRYAPHYSAYYALIGEIKPLLRQQQYEKALKVVKQYAHSFGTDSTYLDLLRILQTPTNEIYQAHPFPPSINTQYAEEYNIVMASDNKTLFFTGLGRADNIGQEDIFQSKIDQQGQWSKARLVESLSTPRTNEAPLAVHGNTMLLFREGRIFTSKKTRTGWSKPQLLSDKLRISSWQADAMITADGQALLFAANAKTDREEQPSLNLYVSQKDSMGNWQTPIELGPTINTPGNERAPFLHSDMRTLYFSSDRHSTIGGLDVFRSQRLSDTSWTKWSSPENLGIDINTTDHDCWYRITSDGSQAVFAKKQDGLFDTYYQLLPQQMRPEPVAIISGKLLNQDSAAVVAEIFWEDLTTHTKVGVSETDPEDGSYTLVVPLGKHYGYYVSHPDYFPTARDIDLRAIDSTIYIDPQITLVSLQQMRANGVITKVDNLFFATNRAEILPESEPELRRVAKLLQQLNSRVEIIGHTDNTGTATYNQALSKARAESVRAYLIRLGCAADMLEAVGKGDTQPLASNDTETGRQQNRRVEIRLIP